MVYIQLITKLFIYHTFFLPKPATLVDSFIPCVSYGSYDSIDRMTVMQNEGHCDSHYSNEVTSICLCELRQLKSEHN